MSGPSAAWASIPLRVKGLIVVAIPLAALVAVTIGLYFVQQSQNKEQAAIREILRVRSQIQTVLNLLLDAETGVRGYGVSEDPSFLKPYRDAFVELPAALAELEEITGEDPAQAARARRIRFLAGRKLEVLARLSKPSFANRDFGPEEPLIQEDNDLMAQLRDELTRMRTTEEGRLREELNDARETRATQPYVFGVALLGGLVFGILAALLFTTGIVSRVTRIEESARRLAKGEPLLDRPTGQDEVGRLAQALQDASELLASREIALRAAKETAESASLAKSDFLSRTSHELRTPLTSIQGLAHILKTMELEDRGRQAVEAMIRAGEHLDRLLNDFLDMTRIEAGALAVDLAPVSVYDTVIHAAEIMRPVADEAGASLTSEGSRDAVVLADAQRLQQILLNLISNGIKYNERGGNVHITWNGSRSDSLTISVADDGPGITPEKIGRIFTPYDRLGAEATGVQGVGLGLAVSRSLAELMGGTLEVQSVPGRGSEFLVTLPAAGS